MLKKSQKLPTNKKLRSKEVDVAPGTVTKKDQASRIKKYFFCASIRFHILNKYMSMELEKEEKRMRKCKQMWEKYALLPDRQSGGGKICLSSV